MSIRLDYDLDQGIKQTIGNIKYVTNEDRLMLDSGAQCCVCPEEYAPEIKMENLLKDRRPNLRTATNIRMEVYVQRVVLVGQCLFFLLFVYSLSRSSQASSDKYEVDAAALERHARRDRRCLHPYPL